LGGSDEGAAGTAALMRNPIRRFSIGFIVGEDFMRRLFLVIALSLAFLPSPSIAKVQYPQSKVTLVTEVPKGDAADDFLRTMVKYLGPIMGVEFAIENITGKEGEDAIKKVAASKPDGSVMFLLTTDTMQSAVHHKFDASFKKLDPLAIVAYDPLVIYTRADTKWKTLGDVVAAAKADPGKMKWGAESEGSLDFLAMEKLAETANANVSIVTHKDDRDVVDAVQSGKVDIGVVEIQEIAKDVKAGKVHLLVALTAKRLPSQPKLPTAAELGYTTLSYQFRGLATAKGMPEELALLWRKALSELITVPAFKAEHSKDSLAIHIDSRQDARDTVDYVLHQLSDANAAGNGKVN
jgi:putative tricarboxylic transport membrane protein